MALLTPEISLSTALENHPTIIPLVSRFGIRLGQGDRSIAAVCADESIDANFLMTMMNTYLFEEYFPEQKLRTFHISKIVDYLSKTNAYYQHQQLPNIERHLGSLISSGGDQNRNLALIGQFFEKFKSSLVSSIEHDTKVWFPYCLAMGAGQNPPPPTTTDADPDDEPSSGILRDLRSIMIRHLSGQYNDNLAYAVIFAITSLEGDIKQHNRIRMRILNPTLDSICRNV